MAVRLARDRLAACEQPGARSRSLVSDPGPQCSSDDLCLGGSGALRLRRDRSLQLCRQVQRRFRGRHTIHGTTGGIAASRGGRLRFTIANIAEDWPGVAIVGRVLAAGAEPWRMSAADYTQALAAASAGEGLPLEGRAEPTPWDPGLASVMVQRGVAVHEETLISLLLDDLR